MKILKIHDKCILIKSRVVDCGTVIFLFGIFCVWDLPPSVGIRPHHENL